MNNQLLMNDMHANQHDLAVVRTGLQRLHHHYPVLCALLLLLCSCATTSNSDRLYHELQQTPGIQRMMYAVLERVYADERIAFIFADTDRDDLHRLLVQQLCELSGGPCQYPGLSMEDTHSGMGILHKEFEAFVEDVVLGMQDAGIAYTTQNKVLALYAPMRARIIHR